MRHRAAELGKRCSYVRGRDLPGRAGRRGRTAQRDPADELECAALRRPDRRASAIWSGLPARGFATSRTDFASWADGRGRRRLADGGLLPGRAAPVGRVDGGRRAGHRAVELRRRQPGAAAQRLLRAGRAASPGGPRRTRSTRRSAPTWTRGAPTGVRFVGEDGPRRFAATRSEALAALEHFVRHRLPTFGPYEDAVLSGGPLDGALAVVGAAEPGAAGSAGGRPGRGGRLRRGARPDRLGGGLRTPDHRLAGLHLEPLLVLRRGLPGPQRTRGQPRSARLVRRAWIRTARRRTA